MNNDMIMYQKKLKENINMLITQNRLDEAKEILKQYKNIVKVDIEVYSIKSVIAIMEENIDEAENILLEGLSIDRENFDLLYNIAYIYQFQSQNELAINYYKEALYNSKNQDDMNQVYQILQELGIKKSKEDLLMNKPLKTSIVILTYNNLDYNKLCIESIRKYTKEGTYEIIVVDNHSTDGTVEWLKKQRDVKIILNGENLGFPKGCNQGIEIADEANDILLLNNDTIVTPNWLINLKKCLKKNAVVI
jgi:tetratricopeptide (TPR) repeat protein